MVTPLGESQADHLEIRELHESNSLFLCLNCAGLHGSVKPRVKKTKEVLYQEITRSISYLYTHGDLSNKIPKRQEL